MLFLTEVFKNLKMDNNVHVNINYKLLISAKYFMCARNDSRMIYCHGDNITSDREISLFLAWMHT